jgi:hypothetical protein
MPEIKLKRGKFKSARGGRSRLLDLYCRKCNSPIATYQKDGPGNLLRLYMDRIMSGENLIGLQYKNIKDIPPLRCDKCELIIGMPYIYEKENRKAFRIIQDAIIKKIKK